jgi:hypothetical protein
MPTPSLVGLGATYSIGSDRYPYTVISVEHKKDGSIKSVALQADKYVRTDKNGQSEAQEYEFSRNTKAKIVFITMRKNGRFVEEGKPLNEPGRWTIGEREAYQDPSF